MLPTQACKQVHFLTLWWGLLETGVLKLYMYNLLYIYQPVGLTLHQHTPAWCRLLGDERRSGLCKLAHCDVLPTLPDWGRQLTLKGVQNGGLRVN